MRSLSFAAVGLIAALSGCALAPREPAPAAAPGAPDVTRSVEQDGKFIALVGPREAHAEPFLGVPGTNFWTLRSWIDTRTGARVHQLYVEDSYFGTERNWNAARTAEGEPLKFVPISKNEISCEQGCSYAEEFGAELPEALLRAHSDGLSVIFTAKAGAELPIAVRGDTITKQLAAVDAARPVAAR